MRPPSSMERIIDRKRYSTATATVLAGDDYWDGNNWERRGRNRFLYRTPNGGYFLVTLTQWQGESDGITPISLDDAVDEYESMQEKRVEYAEAFPGVVVVDA